MKHSFLKRNLLDLIAISLLIILSLCLFRSEFTGHIWIGNPDRLNSDLKVTRHYLSTAQINAWDQNEMMGYDSFSLPYTYPNVLIPIIKLFGATEEIKVMGFLTIALLSLAGIAAYYCIRSIVGAGLPTTTAAICYQFSSLTILKVSQNAMSFAVFIIFPLIILCLYKTERKNLINQFLCLSILLCLMLEVMFLQKAAYVLIATGLYSIYRSLVKRNHAPIIVFGGALIMAIAFSGPRIFGIFNAIHEYSRVVPGLDLKNFENVYSFQNIRPYEIFRWFDNTLFGPFPSAATAVGNNINLNEGFLLYTSVVVPFLILFGLIFSLVKSKHILYSVSELPFFALILLCSILVVVWKAANNFVYVLFLRLDFTHARILIAGLLPLCILVAISLSLIQSWTDAKNNKPTQVNKIIIIAIGLVVAFVLNTIIEFQASKWINTYIKHGNLKINQESLTRIYWSLSFFGVLIAVLLIKKIPLIVRQTVYVTLCGFISIQCFWGANFQVNGRQVFNFHRPFYMGDMYYANDYEFLAPTRQQIEKLHARITPQAYRVALVCDSNLANGFCAGHVPEYWNLRAIDGYYGIGVPSRLAALPWKKEAGLRTLSFSNLEEVPWDLLGFLNVKYALIVENGLYRNIEISKHEIIKQPDPIHFKIVPSSVRVTPRVFFTSKIKRVKSAQEAIENIFDKNQIVDPEKISFVEDFKDTNLQISSLGPEPKIEGSGDHLIVRFKPSSYPRFLVLNELFYPGWEAEGDGKKLKIYPTNVVMRGLVIPPGMRSVTLMYTSISSKPIANIIKVSVLLFLIGIFLIRKFNMKRDSIDVASQPS